MKTWWTDPILYENFWTKNYDFEILNIPKNIVNMNKFWGFEIRKFENPIKWD